jgi:histidyl-tRNA synthetase
MEKSGDELVGQTFSFTDRGGRHVTMLPEATPSVMRMLTSRKDIPRPVRWFGIPKLWRYEEPQQGRLREHFQINADLFGPDNPEADAEIISLAASILQESGLNGKFHIHLNSRELMDHILKFTGISDSGKALNLIDRFHKMEENDFKEQIREMLPEGSDTTPIIGILKTRLDPSDLLRLISRDFPEKSIEPILERLVRTSELVAGYTGIRPLVDLSVVRGLSYYTGTVFEFMDAEGSFRSIAGGGRYNRLSTMFSDQEIPAVGFGMGDMVVELMLRKNNLWKAQEPDASAYMISVSREGFDACTVIARYFRSAGIKTRMDLSGRGLVNQIRNASSSGYRFAVIIGESELKNNSAGIKDMKSGEQWNVPLNSTEKMADSILKAIKSDTGLKN